MIKYTYEEFTLSTDDLVEELNKLGEKGWIVCSFKEIREDGHWTTDVLMMRDERDIIDEEFEQDLNKLVSKI